MDLTETHTLVNFLAGLCIVVGLAGIVLPGLPALPLCWLGVLVWAVFGAGGWGRWLVLGVATVLAVGGTVVKFAWPGRALKRTGVPTLSMVAGGVLGIVGFFVVPVIGLPLGFVLGVWLAEWARLGDSRLAWPSTKHAVKAAGLAILIELGAGLGIAVAWMFGLALA
ncbi:DUF456 domain-containing protein [Micromonospora zhanjiangensis]|uniref:DUF456 domain-containing protein n=1 Tax=Micromonospora zhanjiangensis TaxID=1522057 RepID=A0ABV8KGL7_9ACTN